MPSLRRNKSSLLCMIGLATALMGAVGCNDVYLADGIDLELDLFPLGGPSDQLHLPYVAGATVDLYARTTDDDDDRSSWWLESSNPAVLQIIQQAAGHAEAKAVDDGDVEVRVYEHRGDTDPIHTSTVTVRTPTRAALLAHGPLFFESLHDLAQSDVSRVLAGGTATYLVRYYAGDTRLYGNGALKVDQQPGLRLYPRTTFLFEDREWLQVEAEAKGVYQVALRAAGTALGSKTVHVVDSGEIDRVQLFKEDTSGAEREETMVVLAQGFSARDEPVYGLEFSWDVDGDRENGQGDLYYYHFAPDDRSILTATGGGVSASVEISSSGGWVSSTNNIGCSVSSVGTAGRAGDAALPVLALGCVLLGLVRRKLR
jgi:hypothetical protein